MSGNALDAAAVIIFDFAFDICCVRRCGLYEADYCWQPTHTHTHSHNHILFANVPVRRLHNRSRNIIEYCTGWLDVYEDVALVCRHAYMRPPICVVYVCTYLFQETQHSFSQQTRTTTVMCCMYVGNAGISLLLHRRRRRRCCCPAFWICLANVGRMYLMGQLWSRARYSVPQAPCQANFAFRHLYNTRTMQIMRRFYVCVCVSGKNFYYVSETYRK